jgi:hypothetical protein
MQASLALTAKTSLAGAKTIKETNFLLVSSLVICQKYHKPDMEKQGCGTDNVFNEKHTS